MRSSIPGTAFSQTEGPVKGIISIENRRANGEPTKRDMAKIDLRFAAVVKAFARDRQVSHGGGKGFGSGALKVNGKIFAMISSKGKFVVKLPQKRVDELIRTGQGENFDTGAGRIMKEWVVIKAGDADWKEFAGEACQFVKRMNAGSPRP